MDLKTVFSSISQKIGGEKEVGEDYLAVKISTTEVSAATWKVEGEKVSLGKVAQTEIKSEDFEDLLAAADQVISEAVGPEEDQNVETEKVIFGLPFHWVEDGKIRTDKLDLLRRICKELDLKPLGFVLLSEALENYYKEIEGAPLTAILLEFDKGAGLLTMYRAGKNLGNTPLSVANTQDVSLELEKALKKFTQSEVLPSRIVIYDGKGKLEEIADNITAFPWTKNLPFLHFPRVEILPSNEVVKAIAVAGGMQMGGHFEVNEAGEVGQDITPVPEPIQVPKEQANEVAPPSDNIPPVELEEVSAADAGFLPETEFKEMEIPVTEPVQKQAETNAFGKLLEMSAPSAEELPEVEKKAPLKIFSGLKQKILSIANLFLSKAKRVTSFSKILPSFSSAGPESGSKSKIPKIVPFVAIILILFLVIFGVTAYSLPKVTVLLKVASPTFDHETTVTIVTQESANSATDSSKIINGSFVSVSEIGTKKGVATGKQLVGDPAKGSVTIYSATSGRTISAGTTLYSTAGLKFTLDHEVSVASGDAITRATVTSTITAADIGDSYNLPAGTKFTIGNLSSSQYAAQADQALSGGNSHQATVVAKEDQARLLATLSAELTQKANDDLQAKLSPGQNLLPNAVTSSVSKKKFSADIGSEADTVSLDLTLDFQGVIFVQQDMVNLFAQNFSSDIPAGFLLSSDKASINIEDIKTDKAGNALLKVRLTSLLVPEVNTADVINHISGQSVTSATKYLSQIPGVDSVSVETSPKVLSSVVNFALPWKKENIKLEIVTQ